MRPQNSGFTIIELLVTIGVAAIVLGLGIPNFSDLLEKTRVRRAAQDVVELLQLARLTAVEQQQSVAVCGSSDGINCDQTKANWGQKLIARYPANDNVLSVINLSNKIALHNNNLASVSFNLAGWGSAAASSFFVCPKTAYGNAYKITIPLSGHVRMEPYTAPQDECS